VGGGVVVLVVNAHKAAVLMLCEFPGMFKVMHSALAAPTVDPIPPIFGELFHQAATSPLYAVQPVLV
jgi:hypothetical protein